MLFSMELLGVIICVLFCFRPRELVFFADADAVADRLYVEENGNYYRSDLFVLQPGTYQLRVRCEDHEGILYPAVGALESSYRALRCNGATVFAHEREIEIEAYVTDRVDSAYVICNYIRETKQPMVEIELYRTSGGWRILTCILTLVFTGVNLLIGLRDKLLTGAVSIERGVAAGVLSLSVLLAYLPYCVDYMNLGADTGFHLLRIEGLKETLLRGGQFPVRVQEYWLYGHGYAVSSFYGDLLLFFPALLRLIGFSLMDAYKIFVLAVLAGTAVIAYVSFFRCTKSRRGALLGSVLYELAPYHIHNIYKRGAVGEYLGMMFLPLVFCGFYQLYTQDEQEKDYMRAKIPLIAGLSGILQSHLLTCEMTVVVLIAAALILWRKTFRSKTLWELVKAAGIFLAVNAWFWVPLLKMLSVDTYKLSDIVAQDIQYEGTNFAGVLQMYPYAGSGGKQTEMYGCSPIQAGAALWAVLLCYIVIRLCRGKRGMDNPYDREMRGGFLFGLTALFMSTVYFPWNILARIPGLGTLVTAIQFPTRLLVFVTLGLSVSAAFLPSWMTKESMYWEQRAIRAVRTGSMTVIAVIALWAALFHVVDLSYELGSVRLYSARNMGTASVVNGEYLLADTDVSQLRCHDPVADEGLLWGDYEKEGLAISLYVENQTEQELYMELPLTGYRGYVIDAEKGSADCYITQVRGEHGDLRIAVPPHYAGDMRVSYKGFFLYRVAEGISWMTAFLCMGVSLVKRRGKAGKVAHG